MPASLALVKAESSVHRLLDRNEFRSSTVGCRDWHGVSPLPHTIFDVLREKRKLCTARAEDLYLRLRVVVTLPRHLDTLQKQIASETGEVAHGKDVRAIPHGKETHRAHKIN